MKLWQQNVVEGRYVMSYQLSSTQWRQVESFLPGRPGWVGVTAKDNRTFVNGVLWVLRSGAQWKDLPPGYGNWKSVHKRFTRWARAGIWERIFQVLLQDPDNRYVMIDSTIVAGPSAGGPWQRGGQREALGRSRGGLSTKVHLVADAQGRPVRFSITGGQRADVSQAIPLLTGIETGAVIADKGYESNRVLAFIRDQGAEAVIPPKSNRRDPWEYDRELYRERNLIERAFNKLKQWQRIATRYDRRSLYFLSALHLVASVIWG